MAKRFLALLMTVVMIFSLTACQGKLDNKKDASTNVELSEGETEVTKKYKIGVVTPTLSNSEDEFRAGENMANKYPEIVEHIVLPEDTNENAQGGISQILSLADDKDMKAIVVASGQSGLLPAFQKVKEKRPDILTITVRILKKSFGI